MFPSKTSASFVSTLLKQSQLKKYNGCTSKRNSLNDVSDGERRQVQIQEGRKQIEEGTGKVIESIQEMSRTYDLLLEEQEEEVPERYSACKKEVENIEYEVDRILESMEDMVNEYNKLDTKRKIVSQKNVSPWRNARAFLARFRKPITFFSIYLILGVTLSVFF